jgi:glycogen debranching enzyme
MIGVINVVKKELLTPKGLRTLAPKNPKYHGHYEGNQAERDSAYHQGTAWPWLLGHFADANFKVYGADAVPLAETIIDNFREDMNKYGLSTIPEIYDGDPPQHSRGAISQAWSVGEILRTYCNLKHYKK